MQLTKFTHSCVRLDDGDRSLVFDPGVFSEVEAALDGAGAVLITHEHPDHLDRAKLSAALERDSRLRVYAPPSVAETFPGDQVMGVDAGQQFEAAGFTVQTFGTQHALIHPAVPMIANHGYLVDGAVFHPGDSFTVPAAAVSTLLLPTSAPWLKVSEAIDFAIAVRAPRVHQIHDSMITAVFADLVAGHLARIAGPFGVSFQNLLPAQTVTV